MGPLDLFFYVMKSFFESFVLFILLNYLFNVLMYRNYYIMWNARLDEAQAGINIARRNINNLSWADDTILMAESEEELKSLLMKVKEESEKARLKLNIQKTKVMASGPITSWQMDGENSENSDRLFSWAPKSLWMVTPAMILGRKTRQHIKKQRHYFANKGVDSES